MNNPCKDLIEERTVYRIVNKKTGCYIGVYSRACHDEYDFESERKARQANCHGEFLDTEKYDVVKLKRYYINE